MSEWRIYRKNVNLSNVTDATAYVASVKVLEYRGTFLEGTQVSFDISFPTPISLAYGDKLSYRGEAYVLRDPLAVEKVARRNSYGGAFKYENIVFRGLEWEMQNVEFTDVVPQDDNLHYTGLSTFSFYCDHPQKLIERVQACMDIAYTGTEAWTISLASGFDISQYSFTPQTISISSGTSCWAALGLLYKNWKIPFTRSGKTITVGASVVVTSTVEYGKGNGLMSIKRVPDTDVRVITRLRAYGSQKNMPYRYYNNKGFINEAMYMPYLMLPAVREHTAGDGHDVYLLSANVDNYGIIDGEVHFDGSGDNEEIYPTLEGMTTTDAEISAVTYDSTDKRLDRILSAQNPADNGVCADGDYDSDDAVDTDGVRIVKEFTMTIPYLGFDWKDKLTSEGQATIIMKSGMCAAREFTILEVNPVSASNPSQGSVLRMERINDDVTGYAYPNSTFTINAGDYFVIAGIEMDDVYVIAAENRLLTAASAFLAENDHPNYKYEPSIDNIWMQNHPTDAAKMRPGVKLSFSDTDLGISSGVVTIQTVTIDEGKRPLPEYQVVLNDNVTTTTLENLTAQVDAIMSGNAGVGGGMSQSELMAQIRNVGGTLFLSKNNADTANGLITFLRGLTSNGQANLLGGAQFGASGGWTINNEGNANLNEIIANLITATQVDAGTINAEVLNAKAAHFAQLIIDELRSAGGAYLLSAADCTIDYVETLDSNKVLTEGTPSYYRCYYKANDNDGRTIYQKFAVDDQVMHTTFDKADSGYHLTDNSNRYYWMLVDAVSSTPVEKTLQDGVVYPCHWIDIDPSIAATNSNATPDVDDNIVLLGHQGNDTARQAAIYITAYSNSFDTEVQPPAIVFYQGVNDFTLSGKKPNYWGRDKVVVTGQLFYTSSGSGTGTDVSTLVGADNYSFWLDKSYQQYSGSGELTYKVKMSKNGVSQSVTEVGSRLSLSSTTGCTLVSLSSYGDLIISPTASSGNAVINCYTDTAKTQLWGQLTASFSKVDVPEIDTNDQYVFSVAQDTKTITASLNGTSTTYDQNTLDYTINITINGEKVAAGSINSYLSIPNGSGTNCTASLQSNGVVRLSGFSTSVLAGGSATINCYTSPTTHDNTTLWGVLTLKYNVEWSRYAMSVVDGKLTSYATKSTVDSLGNRLGTAESNITQNAEDISANARKIDANETNIANLQIQADGISANVASQKYNSNLFGFTDGLSFLGTCVPFIQAYGVEFAGTGTGDISGFGGVSMDSVTVSGFIRSMGGNTTATLYVNGTTATTINATTSWTEFKFSFSGTTSTPLAALNSISLRHTTSGVSTVAIKNLKVESGSIATAFCISDSDGTKIEGDNMFTTTTNYNSDPIFNSKNSNEVLDTSNADGHGNVMSFYRNNNSDAFMVYNSYNWANTQYAKVLTAGKVYTISFWARSSQDGLKIHTGIYSYVTGSSSGDGWNKHNSAAVYTDKTTDAIYDNAGGECIHTLTTSWKRYYAHFYIKTGVTSAPIIQCNNGLSIGTPTSKYVYIADVRMEEGYIADDSDPMSISGARTRSEAKFNLTADNIELKLNNTGIDIENNKITLDATNTEVSGNFTAKKVNTTDVGNGRISMEGGLMQVYNSVFANPQIVFGVDENGNIVLTYYDGDGNALWNLGPKGLKGSESQDEEIRTYTNWCIPKTWYNGSWQQSWGDSDLYMIESYCDSQYASSTESFVARILNRGLANEPGLVYQYDAKIVLGNFQAGIYSDSEETAEVYNKLFLNHSPSSSSSGKLTSTYNSSTGKYEPKAEWTATFMRIVRAEKWRTPYSMGNVTYDERTGKYYAVPDDYIDERELEHGNLVDFEVLYDNGGYVYKDPPVYFYLEIYEYGVFKESGVWYVNSSNVYGL